MATQDGVAAPVERTASPLARAASWFTLALAACAPAAGAAPGPLGEAHGHSGVVATRSPLASQVGIDILRQGGNAIDAAVAVGFALAVTYPQAGNIGGGGFMVIRLADGDTFANDHRETAPARAHRDMYLDDDGNVVDGLSTNSHLAVGVPGTVAGLLDVLARFGTLPRQAVIAPAARLAEDGFALPADIAAQFERGAERFARYPASIAKFARADGTPYAAGELYRQPQLAATLERIMKSGRDGFYGGETADLLVAEMERGGGLIQHADLAAYRSVWREPVRGVYRDYDIVSMPPPSSGGVLLVQMLNMLEPFDLRRSGFGSAAAAHLMVEAERRAYADRAEHLGDPDFFAVPMAMLAAKDYAKQRFADFDPARASKSDAIGAGGPWPDESTETTHASVIDAAGNAVAYTTTLNLGFGSKIVVPGAGFALNNEMDDFSAKPDTANSFGLVGRQANAIEPRKRMLSSMTPTIVTRRGDDDFLLVTGSPGGSTIITTVLQVVLNVVDHGMELAEAVASPRLHHQWRPEVVLLEADSLDDAVRAELEGMGHVLAPRDFGIGDANSALRRKGRLTGVSDPRNAGGAAAY